MGANNADFQNQVFIHRGVNESPKHTDFSEVGMHWSHSKDVASNFATMGGNESNGVVLHGSVNPKHVIKRGTPEWHEYSEKHDIFDDGGDPTGEQEVTVREGSPITLHGYSVVKPDSSVVSKVEFPNPRQAKA